MKKELIFICKKCGHNLYVDPVKVKKLFKIDCPECGEESYELWILSGQGNFEDRSK